jgi:hypothetical protein
MFAKLFSNIGIRSMLNSIGFSLLAGFAILWMNDKYLRINPVIDGLELSLSPSADKILVVFGIILCAFLFNEAQNRQYLFKGNYHSMFITVLASLSLYTAFEASLDLWVLVVGLGLLLLLQALVQKEKRLPEGVFFMSLLIGLLTYVIPEAIFILIFLIVALFINTGVSAKSLASIALGYGAASYFVLAFQGWAGVNAFNSYADSLLSISIGLPFKSWGNKAALFVWLLLQLLAVFGLISYKKRLNNKQRKVVNLWLWLSIILFLAAFSLGGKSLWLSMLIYSLAYSLSLIIEATNNKWTKDGILFLVLLPVILNVLVS